MKVKLERFLLLANNIDNNSISSLHFSFNNKDIIDLLDKRGSFIVSGEIENAIEIETKLEEMTKMHYYEMGIPWTAFVIFEEEEACQRALSFKGSQITFSNELLKMKKAPEPSDIIWQYNSQDSFTILK